MKKRYGQASFEYMMSYGWAVLVIAVLAVMLWNIGVFDPKNARQTYGFSLLRPIAWNFVGGNTSSSVVTIALANIGGIDVKIGVNGTNSQKTIQFKRHGGPNCGFINQSVQVWDSTGEDLNLMEDSNLGVWVMDIGAGSQVTINGTIVGANSTYVCGGTPGEAFFYGLTYPYAVDQYNIQHTDSGTITGDYQ